MPRGVRPPRAAARAARRSTHSSGVDPALGERARARAVAGRAHARPRPSRAASSGHRVERLRRLAEDRRDLGGLRRPAPSSSPARRLRLSAASTVAVRSPTPAGPVKSRARAPRVSASAWHSRRPARRRRPAAFRPVRPRRGGGERGGVLGGARRARRRRRRCSCSQTRPAASKTSRAARAGRGRGDARTSVRAAPRRPRRACAGPPRQATGAGADALGHVARSGSGRRAGATRPLREHAARRGRAGRSGRRARRRAGGSAGEGTARQTQVDVRRARCRRRVFTRDRVRAARPPAGSARWCAVASSSARLLGACGSRAGPRAPPRASSAATAVPQLPAPITAAWRSGGRPPSHSHCSSMFGQIRFAISLRERRRGLAVERRGKVSGAPAADRDLARADPPAAADVLGAETATGTTGAPVSSARRPTPRFGCAERAGRMRVPSGKMQTAPPRSRITRAVSIASSSDSPRRIGKAPSASRIQPCQRFSNSSTLATKCSGRRRQQRRSRTGRGSCGGWTATSTGPVLAGCARGRSRAQPEVDEEERLQDRRGRSSRRSGIGPRSRAIWWARSRSHLEYCFHRLGMQAALQDIRRVWPHPCAGYGTNTPPRRTTCLVLLRGGLPSAPIEDDDLAELQIARRPSCAVPGRPVCMIWALHIEPSGHDRVQATSNETCDQPSCPDRGRTARSPCR